MNVAARNLKVVGYVESVLSEANKYTFKSLDKEKFAKELEILEALIPVKVAGFRGIVITAIAAMHIDPKYRASENFYKCNPRSIFEQAIHGVLYAKKIPCGKSDPLNVAKNIEKIDASWANGKRPESAAQAALDYLKLLETAVETDDKRYRKLVDLFCARLCMYAKEVAKLDVALAVNPDLVPIILAGKLAAMVVDCPESGTIPQFVVGNLLRLTRRNDSQYKCVGGVDESVFGTNTTSKKPSDLWEIMAGGEYGCLYEVTVKRIDTKRLHDCAAALAQLNIQKGVTFLCRLDKDVVDLELVGGSLSYNGVGFQFLDIQEFIRCLFTSLTPELQTELMTLSATFMADHNRQLGTKKYWGEKFGVNA